MIYLKTFKIENTTTNLSVDKDGNASFKLKIHDGRKMKVPIQYDEILQLKNLLKDAAARYCPNMGPVSFGHINMTDGLNAVQARVEVFATKLEGEMLLIAEFYHLKTQNKFQIEVITLELSKLANICRDVISTLQANKAA